MTCNNPKLDLVNMNACIKFGEIMLICSQDNECKRNFGLNQGLSLWYKFGKNEKSQYAMLIRYPPHSKSQRKNLSSYSSNQQTLVLKRRFQYNMSKQIL